MEPENIHQPHNDVFKLSLKRIEIARKLIAFSVSPSILNYLDLSTLSIMKDDGITDDFRSKIADVIYRVNDTTHKESVFILFEHKSKPDKRTHHQILSYMTLICDEIDKQKSIKEHRPIIIISIIVYHGDIPWKEDNSTVPSSEFLKEVAKYIVDFKSHVVDLVRIDDSNFGDDPELRAFLLALKYSRTENVENCIYEIIRLLGNLGERELDYLKVLLRYIEAVIGRKRFETCYTALKQKNIGGVKSMDSIFDDYFEKGRKLERERLKKTADALHEKERLIEKENETKQKEELRIKKK
jgi:hypothetical protein